MYLTERMAEFIAATDYENLPTEVVQLAKERIMDTVGAAIAGSVNWEYSEELREVCKKLGKGELGVFGCKDRSFSPAHAAMVNATYAHSVELDDGHKNAGCHAGAVVVPAALTMGQALGKNGKDILTAVAIGYEITYRIAAQVNPAQINRGFHPSSNCGAFGAAAVAGKLLGLNAEQLANALGQAGMLASGTMEATRSGQRAKCIQVGNAAYNGILAAYLAKSGMEGCLTALEGTNGLFATQSERVDVEAVCRDIGKVYSIADTYNKMYPSCRHAQPGIEAALELGLANRIDPNEIEKIWIGTHKVAYELTGIIKRPQNAGEAKFSLAYGSAAALRRHGFGIADLTAERYTDPETLALADRVVCEVDPAVQAVFPGKRGARVRITMKNGRSYEKELYDLKGSPKNPVTLTELEQKFLGNAKVVMSESDAKKLVRLFGELEKQEQLEELMEILT